MRLFAAALAFALAHHSLVSEFDTGRHVTLAGRVTKVAWTNPHAYIYVDVAGQSGAAANWSIQMGSPNRLVSRGWAKTSVHVGDVVTVEGSPAKDGSNFANAQSVQLATGVRLFTGPAQGETS